MPRETAPHASFSLSLSHADEELRGVFFFIFVFVCGKRPFLRICVRKEYVRCLCNTFRVFRCCLCVIYSNLYSLPSSSGQAQSHRARWDTDKKADIHTAAEIGPTTETHETTRTKSGNKKDTLPTRFSAIVERNVLALSKPRGKMRRFDHSHGPENGERKARPQNRVHHNGKNIVYMVSNHHHHHNLNHHTVWSVCGRRVAPCYDKFMKTRPDIRVRDRPHAQGKRESV